MRLDPYGSSSASLRSKLEPLSRAELQQLAEETIRELSRRALRQEEAVEQTKHERDATKPAPGPWSRCHANSHGDRCALTGGHTGSHEVYDDFGEIRRWSGF